MGLLDRAAKFIGNILATIQVDSTGTATGTTTNPVKVQSIVGAGVVSSTNPNPVKLVDAAGANFGTQLSPVWMQAQLNLLASQGGSEAYKTQLLISGNPISAANSVPVNLNYSGNPVSGTNGMPVRIFDSTGGLMGSSSTPFFNKLTDSTGAVINSSNPLPIKLVAANGTQTGITGSPLPVLATDSTLTAMGGGVGMRTYGTQSGSLAANTEVSAITGATLGGLVAGKSAVFHNIEMAFDHDYDMRIKIQPRTQTGTAILWNSVLAGGTGYTTLTVAAIRDNGHPLFELLVDNPTAASPINTNGYGPGKYKIGLKPGVVLPFHNGGDITVINQNTTTARNVTTHLVSKEIIP